MRQKTINLYKFNELDPDVQEKVIEWFRQDDIYFWQDENNGTLEEFEKIFPIKVKNWAYDSYKANISFESLIDKEHAELTGVRLMKHILNTYGRYLWKPKYLQHVLGRPRYSKIQKEAGSVLTGYWMDYEILKSIYDFLKSPVNGPTFEDILEDCLNAWVGACQKDWEYSLSREAIEESITINEYEFTEEGRLTS